MLIVLPPVLAITMAWLTNSEKKYSDLSAHAKAAKAFEKAGTLRWLGKHSMVLVANGERPRLHCNPGIDPTNCIKGRFNLPQDVRVKLFDHKGFWIILELRQRDGSILLSEQKRRRELEYFSRRVKQSSPLSRAIFGFALGTLIALITIGAVALNPGQKVRSSPT